MRDLLTSTRREDRMPQGFVEIVEPMDTLLIIAAGRCETKKSRSCKMKAQPRKRLPSPMITTKDVDLPTDLGTGLDRAITMGL